MKLTVILAAAAMAASAPRAAAYPLGLSAKAFAWLTFALLYVAYICVYLCRRNYGIWFT